MHHELQGLLQPVIDPFLLAQSSTARASAALAPDEDVSPASPETPTPITGNANSMNLSDSRRRISASNPSYGYVEGAMRGREKFGRLQCVIGGYIVISFLQVFCVAGNSANQFPRPRMQQNAFTG